MLHTVVGPFAHDQESEEVHGPAAQEKYGVLLLRVAGVRDRQTSNRQAAASCRSQGIGKVDAWWRVASV